LLGSGAGQQRRLYRALADALSDAGRGPEAGAAYLEAAALDPEGALELRRRAAEELLRSGHLEQGLRALNEVLKASGLELARTPARALASALFHRAELSLRGLDFV